MAAPANSNETSTIEMLHSGLPRNYGATQLRATMSRTETRLVIASALQQKLEALRAQQAACDAERAEVLRELLTLADRVDSRRRHAAAATAAAAATESGGELEAVAPRNAAAPPPPSHSQPRARVRSCTLVDLSSLSADLRGDSLTISADYAVMSHVATAWKVCAALKCHVQGIALGAEGEESAFVVHDRGHSWTSTLPELALSAVQARIAGSAEMHAAFAAFGNDDRYYVRWESGVHDWLASDACTAEIRKAPVLQVAFGATWDSYLALFKHGGIAHEQLPVECERALAARTIGHARLRDASLGPAGEWWLGFADGQFEVGGLAGGSELHGALAAIAQGGHEVTHIAFGARGTWALRYGERSDAVRAVLRCKEPPGESPTGH